MTERRGDGPRIGGHKSHFTHLSRVILLKFNDNVDGMVRREKKDRAMACM